MSGKNENSSGSLLGRLQPNPGWRIALLAGFVVQLLLILFVTSIALDQLRSTENNLKTVLDLHMRKQNLTKTMVFSARERTVNLFRMLETSDPFELDELMMEFSGNAANFINARNELLSLPLSRKERQLLDLQGQLTKVALPIQEHVVELFGSDGAAGKDLLLGEAIPAQNKVLEVLSQLDDETQKLARAAGVKATQAHDVARFWMLALSGIAMLLGITVALAAIRYTGRANREREHLATHDGLTGLPNRMLFMDRLEQTLTRAQRRGELLGVLFIDIDRFKLVNDTLGHASGDSLICEVAVRLRNAVRQEDIVARVGGDEFVVVIIEAGKVNHILQAVEKIIAVVAEPYTIDEREIFSTCSIGVSIYPNDGSDSVELVKNADTAMYHAKKSGRNRFQLYDKAMNAMAEERLQLETDLHYAIERGEFVFHYQPQLNLETGSIQTVEALLRWNHPQKGLLSPADFLELLEETGEILNVGRSLLVEACCQARNWHTSGFPELSVAVNVSGKEFWHESLVHNVRMALEVSGLQPQSLQLELTEGIFMQDIDRAVKRIQELKLLGVALAIDDFGTGYSSLAHLKRFPLDCLKIDRYFVRDLEEALINEAFIDSILALCKGLHLDSVAEGVENMQQLEQLRRMGCQVVQGYLVSKAVPAQQVRGLLERDWLAEFGHGIQVDAQATASIGNAGPDLAPAAG